MESGHHEKIVNSDNWIDIDFEESLLRHQRDKDIYQMLTKKERPASSELLELVSLLKRLFNEPKKTLTPIPQIIHQIWLGSTIPEDYKAWMETWKTLPGFTYRLWTDEEVANFPLQNRTLYESTENPGAKSDIARYEILYQQGGVYADADTECFHPERLEAICQHLSFFAGIEPLCQALGIWIGNSIIGSAPLHTLMKKVVDTMPASYPMGTISPVYVTGPAYFSHQLKAMLRAKEALDGTVIFPTTMLSPHTKNEVLTAVKESRALQVNPETICAHYYGKSWHEKNHDLLKKVSNHSYPSFEKAFRYSKKEREAFKFLVHPLHKEKEKHAANLVLLQNLYHRLETAPHSSSTIPKVIHQIEPALITSKRLTFIASWMGLKEFTYRLWSKEELMREISGLQDIPKEKRMDFAKFSLLQRFGGIYAETNLFCYDEVFFDEITNRVGFFAGLEPLTEARGFILAPLLIGAAAGHPLMQTTLEQLKREGVQGANALTNAFFAGEQADNDRVAFPPIFFYPFDREDLEYWLRTKKMPDIPSACAAVRAYDPMHKKRVII